MGSPVPAYFHRLFRHDDDVMGADALENDTLHDTRWLVKGIIMSLFLGELLLALYLWHRQREHVKGVLEVPPILRKYDGGLYNKYVIDATRNIVVNNLHRKSMHKIYFISIWMLMILFDGVSLLWQVSLYLSWGMWSPIAGSIVGSNVIFSCLCFIFGELPELMLNLYVSRWAGDSWWQVMLKSKMLLEDIVKHLIRVGPTAALVTAAAMILDDTSLKVQFIIIAPMICLYIILIPTWETWLHIQNKDMEVQQSKGKGATKNNDKSNDSLENRLHRLCDRVGFPRDQLFVYPSSDSQTTAFYYGFLWFRRVVVYRAKDKEVHSILQLSSHEIESLVAHELGHWFHSHSGQSLLIFHFMNISTLMLAYWLRSHHTIIQAFFLSSSSLAGDNQAATYLPGAIVVFFIILRWYYALLALLYHVHSHYTEHTADVYAGVELGYHKVFAKALSKLLYETLHTFPSGDPYYMFCYHNHPSLVQRLTKLESEHELKLAKFR